MSLDKMTVYTVYCLLLVDKADIYTKGASLMPLMVDGTEYLSATEAAQELGISRQRFYEVVKPFLSAQRPGSRTKDYYLATEVQERKGVKAQQALPIIVHGIQKNFVRALQEMGIPCQVSNNGEPGQVPMDESLAQIFGVSPGTPIVKRGRIQGVLGTPYRLVSNYYPTQFADEELVEIMRCEEDADMPALIKAKYGQVIEHIEETIITRPATAEERKLLKMRSPGPVFEVRRINRASNGKTVVMISDITMVAKFFKLKYTYDTPHWKEGEVPAGK